MFMIINLLFTKCLHCIIFIQARLNIMKQQCISISINIAYMQFMILINIVFSTFTCRHAHDAWWDGILVDIDIWFCNLIWIASSRNISLQYLTNLFDHNENSTCNHINICMMFLDGYSFFYWLKMIDIPMN